MALTGRLILKQVKYLRNSIVCLPSRIQRLTHSYSDQATETSNIDNSLIQEAEIAQSRVRDSEPKTFEELFKKSPFVSLGNPRGKIVVGTIRKVVEDNLYIDFGWKFPCVCPRPSQGGGSYTRGRKVRILIKELELASKFLGSNQEISLNEADCVLLGLISDQPRRISQESGKVIKSQIPPVKGRQAESPKNLFAGKSLTKESAETSKPKGSSHDNSST